MRQIPNRVKDGAYLAVGPGLNQDQVRKVRGMFLLDKLSSPVPGTIAMRPGEELDVQRIRNWLIQQDGKHSYAYLQIYQFPSGASNLTYLLQNDDWFAVLRRPPFGPLPPKAHDMVREFEFLRALHPHFPLAPQPYWLEHSGEVLGVPFYVMEFRKGVTIDRKFPVDWPTHEEIGQQLSKSLVDALVDLHSIDASDESLAHFGHPQGFLERQVKGWIERYERAKTDDYSDASALMDWLSHSLPASESFTMIHNDYKLNNLLVSYNDGLIRVTGIVDWEMATIGDPLLDLAVALSYWVDADDPIEMQQWLPTVTTQKGFFSRQQLIEAYAKKSGRNVANLPYYQIFAYFKLAVILQQIYARYKKGATRDERFRSFGAAVAFLIQHAAHLAKQAG